MSGLGRTAIMSSSGSLMTNYARIGHAAQQTFPNILQDIISIKEPAHRLYSDVTRNLYLNRNLRADEWSMINNVRTNGYVNFDIPLIYKLVRNLNLVPPPSKGWNFRIPPTVNEISPGDDIERIRRIRNDILHRGNAQVSDSNLTDYFTTFKDIAIRLEVFLCKPNGEYLQMLQNLENCCMDEKTENIYLERLDTLLNKESHQIDIEEWEEQNKLFFKTDAVDFVVESLAKNNCCTVIGTSGIGKSATIHHVALFLRDTDNYHIIPIKSPSDIEKYFQRNRRQIFVIDDICGKYTVIQTEVEKWIKRNDSINRVLKHNSTKIIASCRIQVFKENQFKRLKLFTENFCNLSSNTFHLSSQVKLQIARQYLPERAVEHIKNDLDKYEFLPLMFALYKSLSKENENFDVVKFFKNPFNIYTKEINALYELFDKTKFCALFFLVICNGSLNVSLLTKCESEQERQMREDFFEDCGIPRNTLRQRILEQLESLVPLFVRSNKDLSQQVISFSAIHDKTFDFLCFYFGNEFQKSFLRFADSKMLYERTMLKSLISLDKTVEDCTILIADLNEDEYFKRIIYKWSRGDLVSLFYNRQMSCQKYRNKLIDYLNGLPAEKHRELITLTMDTKESFVEFSHISDGFSGLLPLSPLSLAFKRNFSDLIRYILNFINDTERERICILLIKACAAGLTDIVRKFIHIGSNIHVTDLNGWTPLMAACDRQLWSYRKYLDPLMIDKEEGVIVSSNGKHDKGEIVQLLIEKGAIVNVSNEDGQTPLKLACNADNSDIIRLLIEKGADVNLNIKGELTPLILSCLEENSDIVRLLIEKGADINKSDNSGKTPLMWSCQQNNTDIVQVLIEKGASVNIADTSGDTPLLTSSNKDNSDIVRLLLEKGADATVSDNDGNTPLICACVNENIYIVRLLIEKGADVNLSDEDGDTPLIWTCRHNNNDIVRLLVEKGANVNLPNEDEDGDTPLIWSCKNNNSDNVQLLIEKGADINLSNEDGDTPLILLCKHDNSDIFQLLIEKGANFKLSDRNEDFPLTFSCKHDNSNIVRLLIEMKATVVYCCSKKGATLISFDGDGETYQLLSFQRDSDFVRLLIEKNAEVKLPDKEVETPLMWSSYNKNSHMVRLLKEKGSEVNVSNTKEETFVKCYIDYSYIIRLLIENRADVNVTNRKGETPLMQACINGNYNIVRLLIAKGATVNVRDYNGMSALYYASKFVFIKIVKELILNGADLFLADKNGKTPLMYAKENKDREIENIFSKHLYRLCLFDRKSKIPEHDVELIYEREAKFLKMEKDKH